MADKKVDVKRAPTLNVSGLKAPTRGETSSDLTFTAKWKYPKKAFDGKNEARFEGVMVEWIIDYDSGSSSATKGKNETVKGTRASRKVQRVFTGEKKTEDTLKISRAEYYPCTSGKTHTAVRIFQVVAKKGKKKTQYLKGKKKWRLQYTEVSSMNLSLLNDKIKRKEIQSQAQLEKSAKDKSPVGKYFYVSKTKSTWIKKITAKNPKLYGIGVRVQGWNSKTPTKKKFIKNKKWQTPAKATKNNVQWNEAAPTQAGYYSFSLPHSPAPKGPTIEGSGTNRKVSFPVNDHDDAKNKGDDGTNAAERYDSQYDIYYEKGLYDSSGAFKTTAKTKLKNYPKSTVVKEMTFQVTPQDVLGNGRNIESFQLDEYLKYYLEIKNRGVRGDTGVEKKDYLIACPHNVSIQSVEPKGAVYEIKFKRTSGKRGNRKTNTYTLQRLYNYRPEADVTISSLPVDDWGDEEWIKAANKESDQAWTDVAVVGHNSSYSTQTFTDRITNATPKPFRRTYYRVVAANNIDQIQTVVSSAYVVPGYLKIPSAKDEKVDIRACSSAENGNAIQAIVVFNKSRYDKLTVAAGAAFADKDNTYEFQSNTGLYVKTSDTTAQANKTYYFDRGYDNSNGTEMTWDTFEYAWQSSQQPSAYDFKDDQMEGLMFPVTNEAKSASPALKSEKVPLGWMYTTYYIRGVQPYTKYYIKARRFLKDTETRETDSYGGYSDYTDESGENIITVETKSKPYEVKLWAPERLVEGRDFSVSWVYDLDEVQKGYQLLAYQNKPDAENGIPAGNSRTLFETGTKEDSAPYAVVPWVNVVDCLMGTEGAKEHLFTAVRVYTEDGQWSQESEIQETRIVRPPKASLSPIPDVDQQGFGITLGTDDNQSSIVLRLVAHQLMGWGPQGADNLAEGAIIYSTKIVKPAWTLAPDPLDDGTSWYYVNFDFPTGLALKDGGSYTIEYTAVNDEYDLDSDTVDEEGNVVKQTVDFSVKFADDIIVPQFYVVADPIDEEHSGYVRVSIMDTPGLNEGCVADLYRVTPDGSYLVYEGLTEWRNATLVDRLPPYSRHESCIYRLALRSPNGAVEWDDRSYAMPGYSVRFDWGDPQSEEQGQYSHLTLPYNLKWSDSWTKNSRVDLHLDGTYNGYWRGGVDHKNTLSTELVKLTGADQVARVRALAQFAGPVMVRLPNGCAFAADVQVSNLDVSYDSLTITASFSAQEIRLPERFAQEVVDFENGLYVPMG